MTLRRNDDGWARRSKKSKPTVFISLIFISPNRLTFLHHKNEALQFGDRVDRTCRILFPPNGNFVAIWIVKVRKLALVRILFNLVGREPFTFQG